MQTTPIGNTCEQLHRLYRARISLNAAQAAIQSGPLPHAGVAICDSSIGHEALRRRTRTYRIAAGMQDWKSRRVP